MVIKVDDFIYLVQLSGVGIRLVLGYIHSLTELVSRGAMSVSSYHHI